MVDQDRDQDLVASLSDNDSFCNHSIKHELRPLLIVFCSSGSVSAVVTLIAIIVMLVCRLVKLLTHRLILNKLVSIFLFCVVLAAQFVGLWHNYWIGDDHSECVTEGFFLEYMAWVTLLSTFMMTIHLTILVLFPIYFERMSKLEPFYLLFPWIFPLFIAWIPLVHHNYGVTTWYCWIRQYKIDGNKCSSNEVGWIEIYTLWHGELVFGLILNNIGLLIVAITLCKRSCSASEMSPGYRKALKQALPLVIYPLTFLLLSTFAVANRLYQVIHNGGGHNKWLSYVESVSYPSRGFFAPILTLIYILTLRKMIKKNIKKWKKCCRPKKKERRDQVINHHPKGSQRDTASAHLFDSKDHLTQYGTTTDTCPTEYNWGIESEIERQYEVIN